MPPRPERKTARFIVPPARLLAWVVVAFLAAGLGFAAGASALSIAPEAAEKHGCKVQEECVTTQPSTPAWLTIAGGKAFLSQQTLDGTAANEYGHTASADPTLYGSATPYGTVPASGAGIVDTVLANLAGNTSPGDTYAVVLRSDRTLEVLGPQSQGYLLSASAAVPATGQLAGVVVLAAAPKTGAAQQIVVVTSAGFYTYDWNAGEPPTLSLQSSEPSTLAGHASLGDWEIEKGNRAFTCPAGELVPTGAQPGDCETSYEGEYQFAVPEGSKIIDVYQAPVGRDEYEADEAAATFAIAYTGSTRTGTASDSFTVDFFAYEPDGHLHLFGELQEANPNEEPPVEVRYATSHNYLRAATLGPSGGVYEMNEYDAIEDFHSVAHNGSTSCPAPSAGSVPALAVEAIEHELETGEERFTGGSLCASLAGGQIHYQLQRTDAGDGIAATAREAEEVSTSQAGTIKPPAGSTITAVDGTLDFPCDQFLHQFAKHPTPDGFPETSSGGYCAPIVEGKEGGHVGKVPFEPEVGSAGAIAAQIQYVAEDGGARSLHQASIAHEPEAHLAPSGTGFDELKTEAKGPSSEYEQQLASLPAEGGAALQMLPLDPAGIEWAAHLLESEPGKVLRTSATSNPVPVTVMAAPPYYSGGEQQVTPTATTFSNSECGGSGSEQSNTVGAFAGFSGSWGDDKYELEALAKVEASWTTETEIENCQSFDQEFIAGNFGNNFVADNSLLFRVDTGKDTYLDLTSNSLGVGLTDGCDTNHLTKCDPVFVPRGSQYVLQNMTQLKHPRPNNFYAEDDEKLYAEYGASLEEHLPRSGNPATYPALVEGTPAGCVGPAKGAGSGNPGIADANPFVAPTPPSPPNLLEASQASEVNPASGGEEGGTSSALSYESSKQKTASAEFSVGAEVSAKIVYAKFGAEYDHGWGSSMTESFESGTQFSGGVFDFSGFYDPYSYRLYECKEELSVAPSFPGAAAYAHLPVFFVDYMTEQSSDKLPLNFVTSSASLPEGTAGQEYAGQVFASGGVPGYHYEVSSGQLPPGLRIEESTGQVAGTPTTAGTFGFTVLAGDSAGNKASEQVSIAITPALSLQSGLPEGEVGVAYEQSLGAAGGTPPYTYLLTSGTLPPGLHLNNTAGVLQGTPMATGRYCFSVYVADSAFPQGTFESQECVTISDTLTLNPASLPQAAAGDEYRMTLQGAGGNVSGYRYAAAAVPAASCTVGYICSETEPLPPGLSLEAMGSDAVLKGSPTRGGDYEFAIHLSDAAGGFVSRTYAMTVYASNLAATLKAPAFTGPSHTTIDTGEAVSIPIECEGYPAPIVSISGALPAGLSFKAKEGTCGTISGTAATGTGGGYTVLLDAENGFEPAAGQTFTLTVYEKPTITIQPTGQTAVAPDGSVTFSASATGLPQPTVIWEVSTDGGASWSALPAALSYSLELIGLEALDDGYEYRATFTSGQGSVTSRAAKLTVDFAPEVESQPQDATAVEGGPASFTAAAAGEPAPGVQWQVSVDGGESWTDISGASNPTLTFASVSAKDQGNRYRAVFTSPQGTATTQAATLTVQTPPQLVAEPADQTAIAGGKASFSAEASGEPAPSVQWMVSEDGGAKWAPVKGATHQTLTLEGVASSEDGDSYEAVFTNPAGEVTTKSAVLRVQSAPAITLQPVPATVAAGGNATFTAAASGLPAPTVQWQLSSDGGRTWTNISGAHSPSLALLDVPAGDTGQLYRAVFTNAAGTATTQPALLSVQSRPSLSASPSGTLATAGGTATFEAMVSGSPAPSVQWEVSEDGGKTWVPIPGADRPTLQLTGVSRSQSGFLYRAVISNSQGTVTTTPATLIVHAAPGASGEAASGKACRRAPAHVPFRNRKLGRVIRYTVFVDGKRARSVHGHKLRHALLPKLGPGWHAVRIVAFTARGFRISTRRLYYGCTKGIGVSKVRRHVSGKRTKHRRAKRRRSARG